MHRSSFLPWRSPPCWTCTIQPFFLFGSMSRWTTGSGQPRRRRCLIHHWEYSHPHIGCIKTYWLKSYVILLTQSLRAPSEAQVTANSSFPQHTHALEKYGSDIVRPWLVNYRSVGKHSALSLSLSLCPCETAFRAFSPQQKKKKSHNTNNE